ncbi:MAG: hypothetical protein AB7H81_26280 [Vicinamibacterales bacterium]
MERLKKSVVFWVLLVASVVVPSMAHAQRTVTKKTRWEAEIKVDGQKKGTAAINRRVQCTVTGTSCVVTLIEWKYEVGTIAYTCGDQPCADGQIQVTKASVVGPAWTRVLCESDTCSYADVPFDGNLRITGEDFPSPPLSLGDELDRGMVNVELNDGSLGVGTFVKVINQVQ